MKRRKTYYQPKWRPGQDRRKARRRRTRRSFIVTFFVLLALLIMITLGLYRLAPIGKSGEGTYVYITEETTQEEVLQQIEKRILIRYPSVLHRVASWVLPKEKLLKEGRYRIEPSMSMRTLFATLQGGEESLITLKLNRTTRTQEDLIKTLTQELRMKPEELRDKLHDATYCLSLGLDTISIRTLLFQGNTKCTGTSAPTLLSPLSKSSTTSFGPQSASNWLQKWDSLPQKSPLSPLSSKRRVPRKTNMPPSQDFILIGYAIT